MTVPAAPRSVVLEVEGNDIRVFCTFEDRELVKRVPGYRWDSGMRCWRFPRTVQAATGLVNAFSGRTINAVPEVQELIYTTSEEALVAEPVRPRPDIGIITTRSAIVISSQYKHLELIKTVLGGRWDAEAKTWVYAKSPSVAAGMVRAWANHGLRIESDDGFKALFSATNRLDAAAQARDAQNLPPVPGITTQAWTHQRQAFWLIASIWGKTPQEN